MAFLAVLSFLAVAAFFAMAADAGLWFFDHRTAQTQADAATLAAVQHLPALDVTQATAAANEWLTKNGSKPEERSCLVYSDRHPAGGDLVWDTVKVCVRRPTGRIFSGLSIDAVNVSASARARVGRVKMASVMPWGLVPPDPTCNTPSELCQDDPDGDGVVDHHCGYYPPIPGGAELGFCPWGLAEDKLHVFLVGPDENPSPGNFGALQTCADNNGIPGYKACVVDPNAGGVWAEGTDVAVDPQTGNGVNNATEDALSDRFDNSDGDGISNEGNNGISAGSNPWECDVEATPAILAPYPGHDPDGRLRAYDMFVGTLALVPEPGNDPRKGCEFRLVTVPIIDHFPNGMGDSISVLGIVVFGIAGWDRAGQASDAHGNDILPCDDSPTMALKATGFPCGSVWGYMMRDAQPPHILLEMIDDGSSNPFAPMMIAMVE